MNQDDFRQMLAGRDAGAGDASNGKKSFGGKRQLSELDLAEVKKLSTKKAKKKGKKPRDAGDDDEAAASSERQRKSVYRDRAAERRKGGNGDMIDADEFAHLDAEQSKFLGGDMEHTHLVKGLDYALLAQLKREKQRLLHATEAEKLKHQHNEASGTDRKPSEKKLTFKSRMGRLVYFHACQSSPASGAGYGHRPSVKSEQFLPGRMYYTFNLSTDEMESTPVSVQRSKEDCPEPDEVVSGMVDEALIARVTELMQCKKSGGKKLRKKRKTEHSQRIEDKEGESEAAPSAEVAEDEDDEDIFPDVGEYVPIDQRVDDEAPSTSRLDANKDTGYFSNLSAAITAKEEAARRKEEDAEHAWKETLQKAVESQKNLEREEARKATEAKLTGQTDDYAEYQAVSAFDSDDEDDEETVRRRKAAGLTDRDGGPEAAETEKTRRKKQKQGNKLSSDLEKINKVRPFLMEASDVDKK
ncbi:hypothetical protein BBJ28_00024871 [Nothophytophthora sp. Chile5]|nr:hypothetical protein BBJ28_00024871 [Nothophytophthora sp. Chile5]